MVIRLSAGQCRAVQGGAKRLKKDLKSAGRKAVGVQVPLRAPIKSITYRGNKTVDAHVAVALLAPIFVRYWDNHPP